MSCEFVIYSLLNTEILENSQVTKKYFTFSFCLTVYFAGIIPGQAISKGQPLRIAAAGFIVKCLSCSITALRQGDNRKYSNDTYLPGSSEASCFSVHSSRSG